MTCADFGSTFITGIPFFGPGPVVVAVAVVVAAVSALGVFGGVGNFALALSRSYISNACFSVFGALLMVKPPWYKAVCVGRQEETRDERREKGET